MGHWDDLKVELNEYCSANRGSMNRLAEYLEVHRQAVQRWLNVDSDVSPQFDVGMKMRKWLKDQK